MNTTRLSLVVLSLLASPSFAALITIDSLTRTVTTHVTGGTRHTMAATTSGAYNLEAVTNDGYDGGRASARQNISLTAGATLDFFSPSEGDIAAQGGRGSGFAPVNVISESLVDMTFTIPPEVGASAFIFEGYYTVIGDQSDGTPRVAWNLAAQGETTIGGVVLGGSLSSGAAQSGISEPIQASGLLWPGTYNLTLEAKMGNNGAGTGSFTTTDAFGAAAFQDMRLTVTPLTPIPEPSSGLFLGLGAGFVMRRRRR